MVYLSPQNTNSQAQIRRQELLPKPTKFFLTFLYIIITQKSSRFDRLLIKKHNYSNLMHILLFIPFTQNSQSALFHDAKIPNLALFASQNFPIWGVPDPFPMRQKKSLLSNVYCSQWIWVYVMFNLTSVNARTLKLSILFYFLWILLAMWTCMP